MGDSVDCTENQGTRHSKRPLNFACDEQATSSSVDVNADPNRVVQRVEIKSILRKKLHEKTKSRDAFLLEKWQSDLSADGFNCEILHLTKKHSPVEDAEYPLAVFPDRVLVVYPSQLHTFTHQTGPFQPVRLIVYGDRKWSLQCPIYEHLIVQSGRVDESGNLVELAKDLLSSDKTLCPGIMEDFSDFGYVPKGVRVMDGAITTTHAKSCMIWHVPSSRQNISRSNSSDPRWRRVCSECLKFTRYVKKRAKAKKSVDVATKSLRQMPSSHCPWKFLSPRSKRKRSRNVRQQRTRLQKQAVRFYKKSKVELPANQSNELCQLIQGIESSEEGKAELGKIIGDGNKFEGRNAVRAGDCIEEVWKRDREGFFKDQRNNVTGKKGNRWSLATIRVALAVYNRSPSAYEALRSLTILQLPCTKVLRKVLKDGAEQPGIDHLYFQSQEEKFKEYQESRESAGHPRPLGMGVLMWDEVKIQMKVAWNLKGGGITGFTMAEDELPVLHDVYSSVIQSGCQKASYIVQFLWRDLTSGYDMVGPYFPVPNSMDANTLQQFFMLCLKSFTAYGFRVSLVLCDGASSNLTLLKMLCGYPRAVLPVNDAAEDLRARYFVDMSFTNPEDSSGNPVFAMICPSHQLKNMIAALYSSRTRGSKKLTIDGVEFGWATIEKVYSQEMAKAEQGLSRNVPGLKFAFVYRDNWTRLNVRPAKIMQQRYMIAAIQELSKEPNQQNAKPAASFLEACNLLFEKGLLSNRRINSLRSPTIENINKGMAFFEKWCCSHEETEYTDNSKKSRQKRFLAWQTWDLLRVVVYGFQSFCEWFFTVVSPDGRYFISPLRINGSALESIFSVLKHTSGGNLSAIAYSPALGRLISRKSLTLNKNSEKGYRDQTLNLDGGSLTSVDQLVIRCTMATRNICQFTFPPHIAQSSIGGRQGSNACTIIAVKFGSYCIQHKLEISLLWRQLPHLWCSLFVNAICEGNEMYDELFGDTAVYLDVEDVVQSLSAECNIQSVSAVFGFTNANNFEDLVLHVSNVQQASYGCLIGCEKSVGILVQSNGLCALIDSHIHNDKGAIIMMADSASTLINAYSLMLLEQNLVLNIGTLTWLHYSNE